MDQALSKQTVLDAAAQVVFIDNQPRQGYLLALTEDDFEQYRLGYRCLRCHGVQSEPMPPVCEIEDKSGTWKCGFKMRDDQLRFLEAEHEGERRYGPSDPDNYDYERESRIWTPGNN